jgi:hypothetical protein
LRLTQENDGGKLSVMALPSKDIPGQVEDAGRTQAGRSIDPDRHQFLLSGSVSDHPSSVSKYRT